MFHVCKVVAGGGGFLKVECMDARLMPKYCVYATHVNVNEKHKCPFLCNSALKHKNFLLSGS
jgi:hypothetical protein